MTPGKSTDYIKLRQRLRIARECVAERQNLTDFAEKCGITTAAAIYYLKRNSPCSYDALKDGHRRSALHPFKVLNRLRVLSRHKTKAAAAKELGVTLVCLRMFVSRYAPDGIEDALEDYEEAYGTPLFDQANGRAAA